MATQPTNVDYEALGRLAFPSNRGFPTTGENRTENERLYVAGWNRAKLERQIERQYDDLF